LAWFGSLNTANKPEYSFRRIVSGDITLLASGGNRQNKFIENRQNWIIEKDQTTQFWLIS
jgi:hypothetical protein